MKVKIIRIFFLILFCAFQPSTFSQEEILEEKKEAKTDDSEIVVNFSEEENQSDEEQFESGFGSFFNNPALASGLSSGSAIINRSLESVMEIIFYRLLDQELNIRLNEDTRFKVGVGRDVYPAPTGAYVVVDRFYLGPEYAKEIANIQGVPISLGVDGKLSLFDIYLKTDGMRLAEQEDLPWWRASLNNLFGLLPLLSRIMPPSFNPNELYDPASLLETPFSFPLTIGGFRSMPVGAIRSYNISGGVSLPIDLAARFPKNLKDDLLRADDIRATLPYSIFVTGEYRINVLRRSKNIAWVGLTRVKRIGNRFSAGLGRVLRLLDKVFLANWWTGVPAKLFPLDAQWIKSKANIFNQLYEFDLRRVEARRAYELAVKGEFSLAMEMHQKQRDLQENTGVTFHFTRSEDANEKLRGTGPNLILLSSQIEDSQSESEIEITDGFGKFHILKAKADVRDEFSEALTGRQRENYQASVEMKVIRIADPDDPSKFTYKFDPDADDPIQMTFSYRIQDRYVDAHEYREYVESLRYFTLLPLSSVPKIPRRDQLAIEDRKADMVFVDPAFDQFYTHVTPTHLGRFDATAAMFFSNDNINTILNRSEDEKWDAFARAYGFERNDWNQRESRESFVNKIKWLPFVAMRPFSLFNIRDVQMDFIAEANASIDYLEEIFAADTPIGKLRSFDQLFTTRYPNHLAHALYFLADKKTVPRSVSFNTNAKGSANKDTKKSYDFLKNKVYRSVINFPPKERSRLADEKLNAFYPNEVKERRTRPFIRKIDVREKEIPLDLVPKIQELRPELSDEDVEELVSKKHVVVRIFARNMSPASMGKIYLRFEESGKVQLGKFLLGERVFEVKPEVLQSSDPNAKLGVLVYEFYLTGPLSPLAGVYLDSSMQSGGEFQADVGISNDGKVWSDERNFRFSYFKGKLAPPP